MRTITKRAALCLAFKAFWIVLTQAPGAQLSIGTELNYRIEGVYPTNRWWDC